MGDTGYCHDIFCKKCSMLELKLCISVAGDKQMASRER